MLFLVQSHVAVAARLAVSICGAHLNFTCVERNRVILFSLAKEAELVIKMILVMNRSHSWLSS